MSDEFAWMRGLRLTDSELVAYALQSEDPVIQQLATIGQRLSDMLYEKTQEYEELIDSASDNAEHYKELYEKTVSERERELTASLEKECRLSRILMQQRDELQEKLDHWTILSK